MTPPLIESLRALARESRDLASQIISPVAARGHWLDHAQTCEDAAALLTKDDYRAPVPQLKGTAPLIVYFANEHDRDEFAAAVKTANPNLRARPL